MSPLSSRISLSVAEAEMQETMKTGGDVLVGVNSAY
jgi:hypothetical protein